MQSGIPCQFAALHWYMLWVIPPRSAGFKGDPNRNCGEEQVLETGVDDFLSCRRAARRHCRPFRFYSGQLCPAAKVKGAIWRKTTNRAGWCSPGHSGSMCLNPLLYPPFYPTHLLHAACPTESGAAPRLLMAQPPVTLTWLAFRSATPRVSGLLPGNIPNPSFP